MKKIGILTYHSSNNYGAVLQAYALQAFIQNHFEAEVKIINFYTKVHQKRKRIFYLGEIHSLRELAISLLGIVRFKLPICFSLRERKRKFSQFRSELFRMTKRYYSEDYLYKNLPTEDVFITGSDQVFNPYSKFADVYYLSFNKEKSRKVAYAPSFGISNLDESINNKVRGFLEDFDSLSCREQLGADFLSKLLNKNIPCVADPVFLLTKEEWSHIAIAPKMKGQSDYIFVYLLNGGEPLMELAKKVSEETGLPIVCVSMKYRSSSGVKMIYDAGPKEMLGLINNSSFVVTDSFHGTALSLVLKKKVVPYIATTVSSSRIVSIMGKLGLLDNIVYNVDEFDFKTLSFPDYDSKLSEYRNLSIDYLISSL